MKNTRKRILSLLAAGLLLLALLAACASADKTGNGLYETAPATGGDSFSNNYEYDGDYVPGYGDGEVGSGYSSMDNTAATLQPMDGRKVIMTANMELQTLDYDATVDALQLGIMNCNGYIANSNMRDGTTGRRRSEFTIKVPAELYTAFMNYANEAGTVISRSENSEDVTAQYVDIEARLTSLRAQETRLLELMADAKDLDTLLKVQNQITEVQYSIESYTGSLRKLDSLTSYSTITVSISEVEEIVVPPPTTYSSKVGTTFRRSWSTALEVVQDIGLFLIGALPVLLVLAVALVILLPILRRRRKNQAQSTKGPGNDTTPPTITGSGIKKQ